MADPSSLTGEQSSPKYEVWFFFAAIILINSVFVIGIAQGWIPDHLFPRGRFYLLGGVLAAIVLLVRGPWAVLDLVKPLTVWRISPLWFLAAFLLPIVFSIVFVTGKALILGDEIQILTSGIELLTRPRFLVTIFIAALIGEIVWVGYAIKTLGQRMSLVTAGLITGTVWTLWWLPMAYFQIGIVPNLSLFGLWFNMIGIAFFCAFFYSMTGSGLVIFVMQFCLNSAVLSFPVMPNAAGTMGNLAFSALYMIVGFLFLTVLMPALRKRRPAPVAA